MGLAYNSTFYFMEVFIILQLILYGICGALTTIINILVYWIATRILSWPVVASTVIAWVIAFLFAYWANRTFVFHSKGPIMKEFIEFFVCRIATGVLDVIIMYLFVDVLGFYDVLIKTASNILVIILNYIASKLFIFKGGKSSC